MAVYEKHKPTLLSFHLELSLVEQHKQFFDIFILDEISNSECQNNVLLEIGLSHHHFCQLSDEPFELKDYCVVYNFIQI